VSDVQTFQVVQNGEQLVGKHSEVGTVLEIEMDHFVEEGEGFVELVKTFVSIQLDLC
jgi:hypothetical protein